MYLLKEDGGKLLLESGDHIVLKRTVLNPSAAMRGFNYRFFIDSEEGGFTGATIVSLGAGITVNTVTLVTPTQLRVDVTIAGGASLGTRDLTITTGANTEITLAALRVADQGAQTTFRNGFQYTLLTRGDDIRRQPGINIHDVLNNTPNTCQFTVDGTSNAPPIGEKIEITDSFDNDRLLFAGTVQNVEQIYEGQTDQLAWRVQCIDFTWLFNRRRPFGNYQFVSASDVVKDLVANYAPGFTTNHVQTNLAKVSVTLDGSQDFVTVMSALANAIGGGHWYIDYAQDVHFFHVVPEGLELPPSDMPDIGHHVTIAQAGGGNTFTFPFGYYFLRHTFLYSDGSESAFGGISNFLLCAGNQRIAVSDIPLGLNLGSKTCVGRRLYYNRFLPYTYPPTATPIEDILPYAQINDNTTTSFTSDFGSHGAPANVSDVTSGLPNHDAPAAAPGVALGALWSQSPIPSSHSPYNFYPFVFRYTFIFDDGIESLPSPPTTLQDADSTHGWTATIATGGGNVVKRRLYLTVAGATTRYIEISDNTTTVVANTSNGVNGDPPALYSNVAWTLGAVIGITGAGNPPTSSTPLPSKPFNGHPAGPAAALSPAVITVTGDGYWNGGWFQFKVAFVYRDGSVSFPSPASVSAGINHNIRCTGIAGWNLNNIPVGPAVNGNDVVARFIYYDMGDLTDPNFSVSWSGTGPSCGYVWPIGCKDADWTSPGGAIIVVPDNTTTALPSISLASLGTSNLGNAGTLCGIGNKPYNNGAILSVDPIPIWPNPDGPSLEDVDPPEDIDDVNQDLLHEDSGSQPFSVTTDLSQVRNRVYVVGSGSIVTATAEAGASELSIADVSSFSPAGGKMKIEDPATGQHQILDYTGVAGVVGQATVVLATNLAKRVVQGSNANNFFQADDFDSQKFLAKAELDKDGNPTDGIHEFTIVDTSLKARWQLFMRAYAELELFSKPIVTIKYATRDPKSRSGQTVHVDLSRPPCQGDFLIQDVTIDQVRDESDDLAPRYTVTASSTKFELNDLLLQIIGGKIGGGSSGAGIVAVAVSQSGGFDDSTGTDFPSFRRGYAYWYSGDLTTTLTAQVVGCNVSTSGTFAKDILEFPPYADAQATWEDQTWGTLQTTTALDNIASISFTNTVGKCLEEEFDVWWEIKTPKSMSKLILYVGTWGLAINGFGNQQNCTLRYRAGIDAGWSITMQPSGVNHRAYTQNNIASIASDTRYIIRMRTEYDGANFTSLAVNFTINGVTTRVTMGDTYDPPAVGNNSPYNMPSIGAGNSNGANFLKPIVAVVQRLSGGPARKLGVRRFYATAP